MTDTRLTDEELRELSDVRTLADVSRLDYLLIHRMADLAAELLTHRAADAPFAVGEVVVTDYEMWRGDVFRFVASSHNAVFLDRFSASGGVYFDSVSVDIAHVFSAPPAPTAAEVVAQLIPDAMGRNLMWTDIAADICRELGINPDAPIGEVG